MDEADLFDLAVIGGGINGVGIARDAAGRGLKVVLCDKGDIGGATSSASSKLIHGGLRYLEHGEFGLVRESLKEREILLRAAPHLVRPMRFVLPHAHGMRPAWMIRLGLFLYDHIGGRGSLPRSERLTLRDTPAGAPLATAFARGFSYWDCWADDSRLVIAAAMDAAERGAAILPRVACTRARVVDGLWYVTLSGPPQRVVRARALVNAAGPWADDVSARVIQGSQKPQLTLVQGGHILLPRLYEGEQAYILQNDDSRVVFAIPFEGRYTLVGTTETPFDGDPARARITSDEIDYLLAVVRRYFRRPAGRGDIVWTFAGVRPLFDEGNGRRKASAVSRDYAFDLDMVEDAPLLTVFGGKLTTFRKLGEHAVNRLARPLKVKAGPWTEAASLPGGNVEQGDFRLFLADFREDFDFLPAGLAARYARVYGSRAYRLLNRVKSLDDLGPELVTGLHTREIDYLKAYEWARTAEDVLWRRTKLGLVADEAGIGAVKKYLG